MLTESVFGRLTSRHLVLDRVGAATSDALYEDSSPTLPRTILVRTPALQ